MRIPGLVLGFRFRIWGLLARVSGLRLSGREFGSWVNWHWVRIWCLVAGFWGLGSSVRDSGSGG